jgi:chromosome segregation ATPase
MSDQKNAQRLERIVYHSASPATEEAFTAAARDAFGDLAVSRLDGDVASVAPSSFERALLVIGGEDGPAAVSTLRALRERGVGAPALLMITSDAPQFEAELAELGPAAAFPGVGFTANDVEVCVGALDAVAFPLPGAASQPTDDGAPGAAGESEDERAADEAAAARAAALASIDSEESTLFQTLDALRQRRRQALDALDEATRSGERRIEALRKRLEKTQESLSVEKRQRWEVVLDLRESQERVKEVEERLQRARDGEMRRQREIDALRLDVEQRTSSLSALTRERDLAQQRFEQAQKGLEKKSDQSRARIEELREESERLRESQVKVTREFEDRIAGLELELEESRREAGERSGELSTLTAHRDALEAELVQLGESAARVSGLEEEARGLRQKLEKLEGGRLVQLESERKTAAQSLERKTEELAKAASAKDAAEKELHQLRAQSAKDKEESQAWIAELDREVERLRDELKTVGRQREGELEVVRGQLAAARVELESARVEASQASMALSEGQTGKAEVERQLAELTASVNKERDEAQGRMAKLAEERDRLDARIRRSSAETGKVSDLQKELDTLLAELADKEEEHVALRLGRESLERGLEEARGVLAKEKEEAAARLSAVVAERSELESRLQEAHENAQTLERQMASLRAEVVELEVAREEDAERLREMGARQQGGSQKRSDEMREERDRLKRELDSLRTDAENTRRALADSDARLRKLQQEKSSAGSEPREKAGDLAIQQLRAELGSLGD